MLQRKPKSTTPEVALQKLQSYCAYQERCHQEVAAKLYEFGIVGDTADAVVAQLIEDDFLNEERFAVSYARGKFRIKSWGKIRIRQGLKQHRIPDYSIQRAMEAVDTEGSYLEVLQNVLEKKAPDYADDPQRKSKLAAYGISRGFESDLVWEVLKTFQAWT